jgi:imidazole glycerol-phosphate synthase subunit HisF
VARKVNVPVIASGGCASPEHMLEVFKKTEASAALAASIFHFGEYSVGSVKAYLKERGVNVRI